MQITYIYHSGFLVETPSCYYIFDYYKGNLPALNPEKPVLVFASHNHPDHYNREIFALLQEKGFAQITAILAKDIPEKAYPDGTPLIKAAAHKIYELPWGATLQTLLSTDSGVAFLVKSDDCVIYHGGDLNDWCREEDLEQSNKQMTGSYRHEIGILREWTEGMPIDAAFLPLDPRQGKYYDRGMLYFLEKISVKSAYPMHYWEQPKIIDRFLQEHPQYLKLVKNPERFRQPPFAHYF